MVCCMQGCQDGLSQLLGNDDSIFVEGYSIDGGEVIFEIDETVE